MSPPPEAKPSAGGRTTGPLPEFIGTGDLAALLDYAPRHVTRLVQEGVLAKESHGKFNLKDAISAIIAYNRRLDEKKAEESVGDRLKETRRQDVERKMAREDRRLVALDEAVDCMDMLVGLVVESFETLPAKAFPRDQSERKRLQTHCDDARNRLSRSVEKIADDLEKGIRSS